jgi:hypothetical protein
MVRPLIWELVRYSPFVLFSLQPVSRRMNLALMPDIDWMHYYIEETFAMARALSRSLSFDECKRLFVSLNMQNFVWLTEYTSKLVFFNIKGIKTKEIVL